MSFVNGRPRCQVPGRTLVLTLTFFAVSALGTLGVPAVDALAAEGEECAPNGEVHYVCGMKRPEDLVRIEGTNWVLSGEMGDESWAEGGFEAIDVESRKHIDVPIDFSGMAIDPYGRCPGPPRVDKFSAHGISVGLGDGGRHTVYAVNHGGRESIEVFELDISGDQPALAWRGCVRMPGKLSANSVTHVRDDTLAATVFYNPDDQGWIEKSFGGQVTGFVLKWSPSTGWSQVPGSEIAGNNGIVASPDGKWLYVAGWSDGTVHKLSLDRIPYVRETADLDFLVDNLRFAPEGDVLATGQVATSRALLEDCVFKHPDVCQYPTSVARVDPESMKSEMLLDALPPTERFGAGTAAIIVDGDLWIGGFTGASIAVVPTRN